MAQTCLFAIHFERGSKQSPPRLPKKRPKTITASSSQKNSNATDCVGCATHASPVHALSTAGLQATCCMCKQHVACPAWRNARGHRVTCVCSRTGVQMHVLRCCSPAKSRATALNTCLYTCRVHMLIHMSIHLSTQTSMHMSVHRGAACKYCAAEANRDLCHKRCLSACSQNCPSISDRCNTLCEDCNLVLQQPDANTGGTLLSENRPAVQSSTHTLTGGGGGAGLAVDGNTNGNFHHGSCTHTHPALPNPAWWQVDLSLGPM